MFESLKVIVFFENLVILFHIEGLVKNSAFYDVLVLRKGHIRMKI